MDSNQVSNNVSTFAGVMQILFALALVVGIVYLSAIYAHVLYKAVEMGWDLI